MYSKEQGRKSKNTSEWIGLYMMYVLPVTFVSHPCNGPEMQPISHEKWTHSKCPRNRSLAWLS